MRRTILPYNPDLKEYARFLRRNATLSEVLLWKRLKSRQVCGCDFDRQRPIGSYIVDFYCKDLNLAIEVDGKSHNDKLDADIARQNKLEEQGVKFLRFWDYDVKNDLGAVMATIEAWIMKNKPTPGPSREGSGGRGEPTPGPSREGSGSGEKTKGVPLLGGVRGGFF